ncbi:MAG TPA: methionyl-tRNA formyltransferase [Actinomycetes bacterium]|jgi:methionyl-tRNA formyltransferase|nr:methionyl-tRNA formyltransferase [Actinomycetes bacterium]
MRVVYLGTPAAAVPPLKALLGSGHQVVAVVTRPDRPRDHRGGRPTPSPVKQVALDAGLPVLQPERGRDPQLPGQLASFAADIGVSCAFGLLLPRPVLAAFPRGIVNLHFSLLPAYRGAAPVQRALLDGADVTGVCTFVIDEGMDTGPLLTCLQVPVLPEEDAGSLTARLAEVGAELVVSTLNGLEAGTIRPRPQPGRGVSLAPKVDPAEARLDFGAPAARVVNAVRAFTPSPGAWTTLRGRRLKVTRALAAPEGAAGDLVPGRLRLGPGGRLLAGAGDGAVELVTVQPEGRRPMSGAEFARGARLGEEEWLGR